MGLEEREMELGVVLSELDALASAAGAGVSSAVRWLLLLENKRLSHFTPAKVLASIVE